MPGVGWFETKAGKERVEALMYVKAYPAGKGWLGATSSPGPSGKKVPILLWRLE
jgi:hypothetical protein